MDDNNTRNDGSGDRSSVPTPASSNKTRGEWPWWGEFALALCAMVLAALFLIGLPYVVTIAVDGANDSTRPDAAKAWNAIVPSLLGLTTMTISGIFVFMTFRIDRGAKAEAREEARKAAVEEAKKQLGNLRQQAKHEEKIEIMAAIKRMEVRDEAFRKRMEARFFALDERLGERFNYAEERIGERVAAADLRISDRVAAADARISDRVKVAQDRIEQTASIAQERMEQSGRDSR